MAYDSLYKLFYSDSQKYKSEFQYRFNNKDTIHLNINIGESPAFILPTSEIYKLIISIERTNNDVNLICNKLPSIALNQFALRCLIDEIVLTNNIEGVYSTRKEISEILQNLSKHNKRERFSGLVSKYALLMTKNDVQLSDSNDIRKIYDDIFLDEIKENDCDNLPDGKIFRKSNVSVYSETGKEIHGGVFPESKIIITLDNALAFLNNENIDYLIRISAFHYLFGYIHPFYDGNGRTSRFISSYLLSRQLNELIGYRISYTIKENINKYYKAFKISNHYNNRGDLTPFTEMFLSIINKSMIQLKEALEEKESKFSYYLGLIEKLPNMDSENMGNLYDVLIQAALFSNIGISIQELEEHLNVTYNTLHRRLKRIPETLLLVNQQKGKFFYLLNLKSVDEMFQSSM